MSLTTAFQDFRVSGKGGSDWTKTFSALLKMDLVETDKDYQIVSDLPGVRREDIDMSLQGRSVYLTVERKDKYQEIADRIHLKERPFGSVNRRVDLPKNADLEGVRVTYENGILTIAFPKVDGEAPPEHKKLLVTQG